MTKRNCVFGIVFVSEPFFSRNDPGRSVSGNIVANIQLPFVNEGDNPRKQFDYCLFSLKQD